MRTPVKWVEVGPFRYELYFSPVPLDGYSGLMDTNSRTISIDGTVRDQRETVLHEVLHAIIDLTGLRTGAKDEAIEVTEEKLVSALSPWILTTLEANPKLVAFLLNSG